VGQTPALGCRQRRRVSNATPGKRLQALSGAFNASGSDLADPCQAKQRAFTTLLSWEDSVPRLRPINARGLPGGCVAAMVAACSQAH